MPEGAEYLWAMFVELKSAGPVTFSEMVAYQQMTGVRMSPVEVDVMRRLDEAMTRGSP